MQRFYESRQVHTNRSNKQASNKGVLGACDGEAVSSGPTFFTCANKAREQTQAERFISPPDCCCDWKGSKVTVFVSSLPPTYQAFFSRLVICSPLWLWLPLSPTFGLKVNSWGRTFLVKLNNLFIVVLSLFLFNYHISYITFFILDPLWLCIQLTFFLHRCVSPSAAAQLIEVGPKDGRTDGWMNGWCP